MELLNVKSCNKNFDFDYAIRDNKEIYFIKYKNHQRVKKTIENILKVAINTSGSGWEFYANKLLLEHNLRLCTIDVLNEHIFYCEIKSIRSINKNKIDKVVIKKDSGFKVKVPVNNENRFSDLD